MIAVKINFISGENDIPPTIVKLLECLSREQAHSRKKSSAGGREIRQSPGKTTHSPISTWIARPVRLPRGIPSV